MKFGLDYDSEVLPQSPVHNHVSWHDTYKPPSSPLRNEQTLAIELLNTTLSRMNKLLIMKAEDTIAQRREQLNTLFDAGRLQNKYIEQVVHANLASERDLQKKEINKIIEHQEKLRREEEARQKALQEEKQRKEREEAERIKREKEEAKRKEEEAARKKLEEEKKAAEAKKLQEEKEKTEAQLKLKEKLRKAKEEASRRAAGGFTVPAEVEKEVFKYRQDVQDIKKNIVGEMDRNKELKKSAGVVKRKLNVKFGQLSSSMRQLNIISREVVELVNQTRSNDLVYQWVLNFIAKAIVAQAEAEVIVQPAAAIPLARLALFLLEGLDGLYYYLCARFAKKCALVLGYTCSIDTEEGRTRMGWKRSDEKWEPEVKYDERMGGIAAVWAVMARLGGNETKFPFFNMAAEWRFMARMLNTNKELISNVHYGVFCNWWEAAAAYLVKAYGNQAMKGLQLAVGDWAAYGKLKSYPAATRLSILGEDYATKGSFNLLKEMVA